MTDTEATELARRNYAIEALTLGEENFLQIHCGDEILVTVSSPCGNEDPGEFIVYNGTGMNEDDEEDPRLIAKRFPVGDITAEAWREAARFGYLHALSKVMIPDARRDRESSDLLI